MASIEDLSELDHQDWLMKGAPFPPPFTVQRSSAQPKNLAELLVRAARLYPDSGLSFVASQQYSDMPFVTYPALLQEARCILDGLRSQGRETGAKIALLLERPRDFIPAFWACVLGGYVPCLLSPLRNDPERWLKHVNHVHQLLDRPLLVTTRTLASEVPEGMTSVDLDELRGGASTHVIHEAQPQNPAVLVLTSGSTGDSKAVVLTHGNILASLAGKNAYHQLSDADVSLNWIAFDHIAALSEAHLLPLYAGATQLHIEPAAILSDPLLFLRLIDRHRVSMTFTPNFLLGQINGALQARRSDEPPLQLDLSCLRHIICGGEAIVVATARRFMDLLASYGMSRSALWPAFGMTETCAGCIYSREFPDHDVDQEFAALGFPVAGLQMRVVDEQGEPVTDGTTGELQLRGPMVFNRYLNNDEATRVTLTADGWLRTGDLGRIDAGRLSLVGRNKDSIIVSGVNYFSHELETAIQQLAGVERSFVAAFPTRPKGANTEQLVVAFAPNCSLDEPRLHQLTTAIRNTAVLLWGFRPSLILPLPKEAFPKTSLGKIQRGLLRKRLETHQLAAYEAHISSVTSRQLGGYTHPEGEMETAVAAIFAQIFGIDAGSVSATANFFDLGGTSLDIVALKLALEQRFALPDLPMMTILQNPTVRNLALCAEPKRIRKAPYDPIVALQLTGDKTPLFCVHPGIGEVLIFVSLAKYFVNDRPFYALRARGFGEREEYFSSFEEMILSYAKAIRRRQPQGPYAIAGYSYGAPVAFEIAKLFESQGERVAFVGSIDMPPHIEHIADAVECAVNLAFFLSLIDAKQALELPQQLRAELPARDPCAYLVQIAPRARLAELGVDLTKFRAWVALTHALLDVARQYRPTGNVEAVSVFESAIPFGSSKEQWHAQLQRWDEFSRTPPRYIEVAGEHHTIMGPKHVGTFQATLRAELDHALGGK